jgi:TfoX/Sxy family transcriptional regulator of competence genes
MAFSEALAGHIRQRLARRKKVEEKKMFGGVGFLLNGNLLVGVWKDSLIVRLGPEQGDEALKEPHVKEV